MTELSLPDDDRLAIVTATRSVSWRDARGGAVRPRLEASSSIETLRSIYAALEARRPVAFAAVDAPDAAVVITTSGSAGRPRGVVHTRASIVAAARASAANLGWHADDRWLLCLPVSHAGGLSIVIRCLVARRPVVLFDEDFDPGRVASLITGARVTLASLVPTQLAAMLDDPRWTPPPHLRAVLVGGAAIPPALLAAALARGVPVLPTYGLTETFGQVATGIPMKPLPGVEITGSPLRIRGPMLAARYLDGAPIAPELVTADLGFVDDDGVVHVLGRADEVIVTGGEKVHPLEVEAVLLATPGVRAACAFGVADPRWGQIVGAAVAVDAGFDRAAALDCWHHTLPARARPRRLAEVPVLPVLASGKLDRRAAAALPTAPIIYASS